MGVSLAAAALVSTIAGGVASAGGQILSAQAQAKQAQYQAQVNRNNAILAEQKAEDARKRGDAEARNQRIRTNLQIGRQRAAAASRGGVVDTGANLDITLDTAQFGELDRQTILFNAEREALGFQSQADNFRSTAELNELSASNARTSGFIGAGSTLLTSGGQVASKWQRFNQSGAL